VGTSVSGAVTLSEHPTTARRATSVNKIRFLMSFPLLRGLKITYLHNEYVI
jgi:hypothetical protein